MVKMSMKKYLISIQKTILRIRREFVLQGGMRHELEYLRVREGGEVREGGGVGISDRWGGGRRGAGEGIWEVPVAGDDEAVGRWGGGQRLGRWRWGSMAAKTDCCFRSSTPLPVAVAAHLAGASRRSSPCSRARAGRRR